jgi:DNA-binding NarL/FixJ family response regulator
MSGSEVADVHVLAFAAGCVGFLAKNRPWGEVGAAVRAAAGGQSVMRVEELTDLLAQLNPAVDNGGKWLTPREIDVLRLLANGRTTAAIAAELFLSAHTVRNHISSILSKLGAHSKLEAVAVAARDGLVSFDTVRHESKGVGAPSSRP